MVEKYVTFTVRLTEDAKLHQGCQNLYHKVAGADRAQHVPAPTLFLSAGGWSGKPQLNLRRLKHFLKNEITNYHAWHAKVLQ